jgi:hypothetical protein
LPDRIASRNSAEAIFPGIFPSAREVPQLFGLKGAAAQLVVGMAFAGHPARQLLVRIGAAHGVDLGHVGRILGELDDEAIG